MTFVAIDDSCKPTMVPKLDLETDNDKRRWAEAEERRKDRLRDR